MPIPSIVVVDEIAGAKRVTYSEVTLIKDEQLGTKIKEVKAK